MLNIEQTQNTNEHVPIIMEESLYFILDYIEAHDVKDILEVGTAVAYSSIRMAEMDPEIHVDTLEKNEESYQQAVQNVQESGFSNQINLVLTDAIEYTTARMYDLIFIDAAKSQYGNHMKHFEKNIKTGGAFIFDNINFYGLVDAPYPAKTRNVRGIVRKLREFREEILNHLNYETVYHPELGDGIIVAVKK